MHSLGATSTAIPQLAGCSPSNISRLYVGTRVPKPSSPTLEKLLNGTYLFVKEQDSLAVLCSLFAGAPDGDEPMIEEKPGGWLYAEDTSMLCRRWGFHSATDSVEKG